MPNRQRTYELAQPQYQLSDQIFLIKTRLNKIATHPERFSRKQLLEAIVHLDWIAQEI